MKSYIVLNFYDMDKDTIFRSKENAQEYARRLYKIKKNSTLPKICEPEEIEVSLKDYCKMKLHDE